MTIIFSNLSKGLKPPTSTVDMFLLEVRLNLVVMSGSYRRSLAISSTTCAWAPGFLKSSRNITDHYCYKNSGFHTFHTMNRQFCGSIGSPFLMPEAICIWRIQISRMNLWELLWTRHHPIRPSNKKMLSICMTCMKTLGYPNDLLYHDWSKFLADTFWMLYARFALIC